jgi:uncharacterized protein
VIVVDVNLLLYAVVTGFPQHNRARAWWDDTLNGPREVGLASPALFGFLRVVTNPRVLETPLTVAAAVGHVTSWLDQPNVRFLSATRRNLDLALQLLADAGTGGNLTTDAQLAAFALELDAELNSNDTDFGRFKGIRWVNPLT